MRSACFACCLGLCYCQNMLIAKTCLWFSVASAAEEEHINTVNSCLSATRVSIVVCSVPVFLLSQMPCYSFQLVQPYHKLFVFK